MSPSLLNPDPILLTPNSRGSLGKFSDLNQTCKASYCHSNSADSRGQGILSSMGVPEQPACSSSWWLCLTQTMRNWSSVPCRQAGRAPQSNPVNWTLDSKLGMEAKGEEARVEGAKANCQLLGNFNPKAVSQGRATEPKITSEEGLTGQLAICSSPGPCYRLTP